MALHLNKTVQLEWAGILKINCDPLSSWQWDLARCNDIVRPWDPPWRGNDYIRCLNSLYWHCMTLQGLETPSGEVWYPNKLYQLRQARNGLATKTMCLATTLRPFRVWSQCNYNADGILWPCNHLQAVGIWKWFFWHTPPLGSILTKVVAIDKLSSTGCCEHDCLWY